MILLDLQQSLDAQKSTLCCPTDPLDSSQYTMHLELNSVEIKRYSEKWPDAEGTLSHDNPGTPRCGFFLAAQSFEGAHEAATKLLK